MSCAQTGKNEQIVDKIGEESGAGGGGKRMKKIVRACFERNGRKAAGECRKRARWKKAGKCAKRAKARGMHCEKVDESVPAER